MNIRFLETFVRLAKIKNFRIVHSCFPDFIGRLHKTFPCRPHALRHSCETTILAEVA